MQERKPEFSKRLINSDHVTGGFVSVIGLGCILTSTRIEGVAVGLAYILIGSLIIKHKPVGRVGANL